MQTATAKTLGAPIHQRRAHKRFDYSASCVIHKESAELNATVRNISEGGINVQLDQLGAIQIGKTVTLEIDKFAPVRAVVRWNECSIYGMQFLSTVSGHPQLSELVEKLSAEHTY